MSSNDDATKQASSGQGESKKPDDDEREMVTLPGGSHIAGIGYRRNADGTDTYFPKTSVSFFSPHEYKVLQQKLEAAELALLEKNLVEGIYQGRGSVNATPEWKKALDLSTSIEQASDKEYLFIARRHLQGSEVVGVAHLTLGRKDTCVAQSYPARIGVTRRATLDVCRGASKHALRALLAFVCNFFEGWASFQIQLDKAENGGLDSLSCHYVLRLPVAAGEGTPKKVSKVNVLWNMKLKQQSSNSTTKDDVPVAWMRPTAKMCHEWGYETKETLPRGREPKEGDETVLILRKMPKRNH